MLFTVIVQSQKCHVAQRNNIKKRLLTVPQYNEQFGCYSANQYTEAFDMMNPIYNKIISSVPWHFIKWKLFCLSQKNELQNDIIAG